MFLRTPYNYDTDAASLEAALTCPEKTLTQQHHAEDCDINVMLQRFNIIGQDLPPPRPEQFGDFTDGQSFHEAMNAVRAAGESFMALPAELRARFGNDPARLLDFVHDPGNREEAVKIGLIPPPIFGEKTLTSDVKPPKMETQSTQKEPLNGDQKTTGSVGE